MVQNVYNQDLEAILALLNGKKHLRSMAKNLDMPHATLLRKLNRLVEENAIGFFREGKNRIFFIKNTIQARNYVYNAERYKLMRLVGNYPELGIIIEDVIRKTEEKPIVLFGSYAKFNAKKDSDIDIYVETESRKTKDLIEQIHSKIMVKIGIFDKKSPLIREIIKNHVILKGVEEFYEKTGFFEEP
ncbi:MAG: nucleotidyltransferase domain-containing protein [Nanoarchaeota archaeon]|nr:nucleotidyltransferase domain-containing protein [Nanoarchaeota archaeon]